MSGWISVFGFLCLHRDLTQESITFLLTAGPYPAFRFSVVILTCLRNINKTEWALPGTIKSWLGDCYPPLGLEDVLPQYLVLRDDFIVLSPLTFCVDESQPQSCRWPQFRTENKTGKFQERSCSQRSSGHVPKASMLLTMPEQESSRASL